MDIFRWKYNTNKLHLLFMFSYSLSNVFNVKNTPSGREEMLFEDKSLLRKKNTRENITEQIESMNISGWKYYTNMLNHLFMIKVPKTVCSLTASPTFLKTKILFQVEWQCCWKTNTCWEKKIESKYYWNKLNPWICQHFKTTGITYNFRSSTKCEKKSSGRTSMALKNKSLLGKNNLEDIVS